MRIHALTLLLLIGGAPLAAAPPDATTPVDEIDVDAMARAKDVKAVDTPSAATPDESASVDQTGNEPPPEAAEAADADAHAAATQDGAATEAASSSTPIDAAADEPAAAEAAGASADAAADVPDSAPAADAERRRADACIARTGSLLDAAVAGDFDKATRDFDAKMRSAMTAGQFGQNWASLAQFGRFTARGQSHPALHEGYVVVTVPLVFEKANLYAQVSCGSDGRIAGFYVKPLQLPAQ